MRVVGAFEAKNTFGTLLDLVEKGEEITITRHGKPAARLVAARTLPGSEEARGAAARIRERRKGVTLGGIPIRELIDEGRR
jgi:prevent-host-death family protein